MKHRRLRDRCAGRHDTGPLTEHEPAGLCLWLKRSSLNRAVTLWLMMTLVVDAAYGCNGYSDGSSLAADSTMHASPLPLVDRAPPSREAPVPTSEVSDDAGPSQPPSMPMKPDTTIEMDASQDAMQDRANSATLRVARSARFDGYFTDGFGQPLYMFIDDVSGALESACLCDCAREWPPFDVEMARTTADLDPAQVSRFHRQDGAWQTTYKGHALYYRAAETGMRDVTGDAVDGRWFVARDYTAFLSSARTFTPAGGAVANDAFLTDGFGRTLYICLDDQPRTAMSEAISSCDAACTSKRPPFAASEMRDAVRLPSVIDPGELQELVRPDGQPQLSYRGWPLYYYRGDVGAGSTEGHNERAWRAIDPIAFGLDPEPNPSD
jgi:predicted lipoprotein with Yx(FWY)xxD motif